MEMSFRMFDVDERNSRSELDAIDSLRRDYASLFPLGVEESESLASYEDSFLVRFTYNSAAIEGSTLSLGDTALVLEGEFMPSGDKRLSDVFAARGIADACSYAEAALQAGRVLDEELVKDLHERLALDCQPRLRGSYRVGPVFIRGSLTTPVAAGRVREAMGDLMYVSRFSNLHPVVKAAAFHAAFENVHPFSDGNGRVGRLILNYMLMSAGFPPIAIKSDMRGEYVTSLERWQVAGDPTPLVRAICDSVRTELEVRTAIVTDTRRALSELVTAPLDRPFDSSDGLPAQPSAENETMPTVRRNGRARLDASTLIGRAARPRHADDDGGTGVDPRSNGPRVNVTRRR